MFNYPHYLTVQTKNPVNHIYLQAQTCGVKKTFNSIIYAAAVVSIVSMLALSVAMCIWNNIIIERWAVIKFNSTEITELNYNHKHSLHASITTVLTAIYSVKGITYITELTSINHCMGDYMCDPYLNTTFDANLSTGSLWTN